VKQVRDLSAELFDMVSEDAWPDTRFRSWAKFVTAVDTSKVNGYAFKGEFVEDGTVEVEIKPQVFLIMTTNGSRKYQTQHYSVVTMDAVGTLALTNIYTTDEERGWALRIRDKVAALVALVAEISGQAPASPLAGFSDEELVAELRRRGLVRFSER